MIFPPGGGKTVGTRHWPGYDEGFFAGGRFSGKGLHVDQVGSAQDPDGRGSWLASAFSLARSCGAMWDGTTRPQNYLC